MDELEIAGKRYLSSRRAAKEHRYHIDYIGQLIRAGKVTGKKVGRSWYVEETSLKNYLAQEAGEKPVEAMPQTQEVVAEPKVVAAVVRSAPEPKVRTEVIVEEVVETVAVAPVHQPGNNFYQEERKVHLSAPEKIAPKPGTLIYIQDDEPMLPVLEGRRRANADFVAVPMRRVSEEIEQEEEEEIITAEDAEPEFIQKKDRVSWRPKHMHVLAAVAVVVLAAATLASTMLGASIKVAEGQPASVGYTIK
jgi:hypothetical protein